MPNSPAVDTATSQSKQQPDQQANRHHKHRNDLRLRIQSQHSERNVAGDRGDQGAALTLKMHLLGLIQRAPVGLTAQIGSHRRCQSAVQPQVQKADQRRQGRPPRPASPAAAGCSAPQGTAAPPQRNKLLQATSQHQRQQHSQLQAVAAAEVAPDPAQQAEGGGG
jgi:hypothetical protein